MFAIAQFTLRLVILSSLDHFVISFDFSSVLLCSIPW